MDNFDYPAIGQRIKQLRKRKGLNQTELAQMLKKSLRTVQKYETGEIEVSIAVVNQIADLLDTTSTYILGYESSTTQIRTLADVVRQAGFARITGLLLIFYLLCSTAVWLSEPTTLTFGDGLWFSFETVSTIGFGDIPAETPVARGITVILSVISIFYIAMLTGVAVNYCNTLIKLRQKDTMARFMDDLEHLEELDRDELADLSRRVREYRRRQR